MSDNRTPIIRSASDIDTSYVVPSRGPLRSNVGLTLSRVMSIIFAAGALVLPASSVTVIVTIRVNSPIIFPLCV